MVTTATMVYEQHHHGFRLTIRRGPEGQRGTQLWYGDSLTLEDAAARLKRYGCEAKNVNVLPAQA